MMFICGKRKDDFLLGASTCPVKGDSGFKTSKAENNMVMCWLITSITPNIGENFLLYPTTKDIWEAARDMYSFKKKITELFETESILHEFKLGDGTVT